MLDIARVPETLNHMSFFSVGVRGVAGNLCALSLANVPATATAVFNAETSYIGVSGGFTPSAFSNNCPIAGASWSWVRVRLDGVVGYMPVVMS